MREWFRYQGKSIYNTHLDPDYLEDMITCFGEDAFVMRKNAMSMEKSDE
jgi:hypothetical protein